MTNRLAGRINGKQKAIGFILLFPMYLFIVPRFVNFVIYLLLKYTSITHDLTTLGIYLNLVCSLISFAFAVVLLKDFLIENIKKFKEELSTNILYSATIGIGMIYMFIQSVILAPVLEELLFRGLIFRSLRSINRNLAFFASAFLFGFLHIYSALFAGDLTQLVYLLSYGGMGFVFTYTYEKRKTICVPMLIHMINNLVAVLFFFLA